MKESNWIVEIIMCLRFPLCFGRMSYCARVIRVSIFLVSLLSGSLLWIRLLYMNYLDAPLASTLHLKLSLARCRYILPIFVQPHMYIQYNFHLPNFSPRFKFPLSLSISQSSCSFPKFFACLIFLSAIKSQRKEKIFFIPRKITLANDKTCHGKDSFKDSLFWKKCKGKWIPRGSNRRVITIDRSM